MTSALVLLPASPGASFLLSPRWPCPPPVLACSREAAAVSQQAGKPAQDKVRGRFGGGGGRQERKGRRGKERKWPHCLRGSGYQG